jgi:hypothetical protein
MTKTRSESQRIIEEVTSWPGIEAGPGRRGEFAFRVGRREIGHLHGDRAAHFSFPKRVWADLFAQGRVVHHPVFPDREGPAARGIEGEDDVRDVIELLRLNYGRVVDRHGLPLERIGERLYASRPEPLPFARSLAIRAFLLQRENGNVLIYSTAGLEAAATKPLGGISRQYLNHHHEALFAADSVSAPLFVHDADRPAVAERMHVRGGFSKRHVFEDELEVIPTPGHTPGATAYLWDSGERRYLFTGDTIYLRDGEWVAAVLDSSDREAYVESLDLIRELDFDVLVPWAATSGQQPYAVTDRDDAGRRIDAIASRVRDSSLSS